MSDNYLGMLIFLVSLYLFFMTFIDISYAKKNGSHTSCIFK